MVMKNKRNLQFATFLLLGSIVAILSGCGSSSSSSATASPTATPTPTPTALGSVDIPVTLSGDFSVSALTPNPAAAGSGTLTLNLDTGALSGSITTSGLSSTTTNAHIHTGLAGKAGGVVVALDFTTTANTVSVIPGTVLSAAQVTELLNANYYINVHTANNTGGELRGQILPANFRVLRTELDGTRVTVPTGSTNTGISFLTINTDTLSVRGNITNTGLDNANLAHIHGPAIAGVNAGVLVTFVKDSTNLALWELPDNTVVSQTIMDNILAGETYINVHSADNGFPGGEIRGQILPANFQVLRTELDGTSVTVPTGSTNTGISFLTINTDTLSVRGNITNTGLDNANLAHIHGPVIAGVNAGVLVTFVKDSTNLALWELPDNTVVSQTIMDNILAGETYINVHSADNGFPGGEIRGQILPANFQVIRTLLNGASVTTPTGSANTGISFLTINPVTLSVRGNITNTGLDNATLAHIHGPALTGVNAGVLVTFIKDATNLALWELPDNTLVSQTIMDNILAGETYINVHSAAFPGGEIRGQVEP
jgi:hypothetical protein